MTLVARKVPGRRHQQRVPVIVWCWSIGVCHAHANTDASSCATAMIVARRVFITNCECVVLRYLRVHACSCQASSLLYTMFLVTAWPSSSRAARVTGERAVLTLLWHAVILSRAAAAAASDLAA